MNRCSEADFSQHSTILRKHTPGPTPYVSLKKSAVAAGKVLIFLGLHGLQSPRTLRPVLGLDLVRPLAIVKLRSPLFPGTPGLTKALTEQGLVEALSCSLLNFCVRPARPTAEQSILQKVSLTWAISPTPHVLYAKQIKQNDLIDISYWSTRLENNPVLFLKARFIVPWSICYLTSVEHWSLENYCNDVNENDKCKRGYYCYFFVGMLLRFPWRH